MNPLEACIRPDSKGIKTITIKETTPSMGAITVKYEEDDRGLDYSLSIELGNISPDNPDYGDYSEIRLTHGKVADEHAYPLYEEFSLVTVSHDGTEIRAVNIQNRFESWTGSITTAVANPLNPSMTQVDLIWQNPSDLPQINIKSGHLNNDEQDHLIETLPQAFELANNLTAIGLGKSNAA